MATDAQTLINQVAAQGYEKLSKRELIECLLAAAQVGGGGGTPAYQDMQVAWTPTNTKAGESLGFYTTADIPQTSLTFFGTTSLGGFTITNTTILDSIAFPNLTSIDPLNNQGGSLVISPGGAMTSISLPVLAIAGYEIGIDSTQITSLSLPSLVSTGGHFVVRVNSLMTSLSAPLLQTVGDALGLDNNATLASVDLGSLTTVSGQFRIYVCPQLTVLSVPNLVTATAGIDAHSDTALTTVDLTSFVPNNGSTLNFSGCALSAASVNHILARCVANAGYVSGLVDLSGGTSDAPTGQGIADKATLNGRLPGLAVTN